MKHKVNCLQSECRDVVGDDGDESDADHEDEHHHLPRSGMQEDIDIDRLIQTVVFLMYTLSR